jgi:hypothetical protein
MEGLATMADEPETLSEDEDVEAASDQNDDDNDFEAHVLARP